jgi:hypothetical protein
MQQPRLLANLLGAGALLGFMIGEQIESVRLHVGQVAS